MDYRKTNEGYVVRLERGEEIIECVKAIALKENIKAARIEAIGAVNDFTVGAYSVEKKKYFQLDYKGEWEIVSLLGNITRKDNEPYIHLHMMASDENGNFAGGHLNKAIINVTCEMFIVLINVNVDRKLDNITGINMFDFK